MNLKQLIISFIIVFLPTQILAKESNNHQFNFFTGNFDFSDDKQAAVLVGLQHQNESLKRDTIIGKISPITGGFVTENSAIYIYTGLEGYTNSYFGNSGVFNWGVYIFPYARFHYKCIIPLRIGTGYWNCS